MSQNLQKMVFVKLKLALLTILVLRFGQDKNMETSVIFGHLDACFMKCALLKFLSKLMICLLFIEE